MHFYEINIYQILIFRLYTVYNNHDDDKNWQSNQRKIPSIIASARIILLSTVGLNSKHIDQATSSLTVGSMSYVVGPGNF